MEQETKELNCHDCEAVIKILDEFGELDESEIKFCPKCGSENIVVE